MALTYSETGSVGSLAPEFRLKGVLEGHEKLFVLSEIAAQAKGALVVFMCNHCPYVQAVKDRINDLAKRFTALGLPVVGISPNDAERYPDDSFEAMKRKADEWGFVFPYLIDETQETARAYGAVCTPDFYLLKKTADGFEIAYRGRLDDNWKDSTKVTRNDLADAMTQLLADKKIDSDQKPSMGCSIKWK